MAVPSTAPMIINRFGMIRWSRSISVTGTSSITRTTPSSASAFDSLDEHDQAAEQCRGGFDERVAR